MNRLISVIRITLGVAMMGVCAVGFAGVCVALLPWRQARIRATNLFGHALGYACARLTGARFTDEAKAAMQANYPALYVSNHSSLLDVFMGIWLCPLGTCGVGKREVIYYPFFGQLYWLGGHLRLDRKNLQSAKAGMAALGALVRKHRLGIWVWPEGTRSRDGRLQNLKKGFAHMALATGLPVVPVVVSGTHKVWPTRTFLIKPGTVNIKVLPPIRTEHWTAETLDQHIAEVHAALNAGLPPDQQALAAPAPAVRADTPVQEQAPAPAMLSTPAAPAL